MAFRLFSRNQVFFDNLGQPLAGGTVEFYDTGTTTPKDVYSDEDLAVNLGSTETLDSAGRFSTGIWGSGTYRVRFYDADGAEVADDDPINDPADAGLSIPSQTGHANEFLTTNGTTLSWYAILASLLPDMTGNADKVLGTDGTQAIWQSIASLNIPDATVSSGKAQIDDLLIQWGTGTAPASGTYTTSLAVTYGTAYTTAPFVAAMPYNALSGGPPVAFLSSAPTTTGFTATFDVAEGAAVNSTITATVSFGWLAVGIKTA